MRTQHADHVTTDEGSEFAKEIGAAAFLECSSLSMNGIVEVFQTVIKVVLKNRKRKSSIIKRLFSKSK